jgi:hypothetical protein
MKNGRVLLEGTETLSDYSTRYACYISSYALPQEVKLTIWHYLLSVSLCQMLLPVFDCFISAHGLSRLIYLV